MERSPIVRLKRRNAELSAANVKLSGALKACEVRRQDFGANLSHELMTPVAAIKGYSESLAGGTLKIPGRGAEFARIIEQNAERLTHVIEDILRLSSFESGAPKRESKAVALRGAVRTQLAGLKAAAARRSISLRVAIPAAMKVLFNKEDLSRILRHLLANAVKYNRTGGRVEIAARRDGRRAVVSIQDTGIGVPSGELAHIFDCFNRATNARAKTGRAAGLGLALVRTILLANDCRIWAESVEGEGATFFLTLPLAAVRRGHGGFGSRAAARTAAGRERS